MAVLHVGMPIFACRSSFSAGQVRVHDERSHPSATPGVGERDDRLRDAAIGNQVIDTVENEMIAAPFVGGLHLQRIAAGLRLREPKCQDLVAARGSGQVAFLQVLAAPGEDRIFTDGRVAGEERAHAGAFAADASQRPRVGHRVGPAAIVFERHRHAEDVVLPPQGQHLVIEAAVR
jgi:hypothetical protein